jgi:TRAP-type C4-dicarboxylate transport system permease small subunit
VQEKPVMKSRNYRHISKQADDEIQYYGISLVALGLIVEVTDYVNNQLQTDGMSMLAFEATALIQWLVLVVVLIDTCGLCLVLLTSLWRRLKKRAMTA